jgi:hypothetical protein
LRIAKIEGCKLLAKFLEKFIYPNILPQLKDYNETLYRAVFKRIEGQKKNMNKVNSE